MNNTIQSFKIFISFFLLFLCTSCETKNVKDIPFNQFKDVYQVYGKKLNVDTYKFSTYGKMLLFEKEEYIIRENFKSESLIDKIYYTKDSLISLVKFGQGPNENLSSRIMQKHSDTCFSIFDGKRKTILFKDISGNTLFESKFSELFFSAIQTNDGYLATGIFDKQNKHRYILYDQKGNKIQSFGYYPQEEEEIDITSKNLAYQGSLVYNKTLNRFLSTTNNGCVLELYQLGEKPYLIQGYYDILPVYAPHKTKKIDGVRYGDDNQCGYIDLYATEQYVYGLYSGKKLENRTTQGLVDAIQTNHILIYDWNGNCVCRLVTDKPLFNICVSQDNQELIALGWEDDYYLYSFDLSEVNLSNN